MFRLLGSKTNAREKPPGDRTEGPRGSRGGSQGTLDLLQTGPPGEGQGRRSRQQEERGVPESFQPGCCGSLVGWFLRQYLMQPRLSSYSLTRQLKMILPPDPPAIILNSLTKTILYSRLSSPRGGSHAAKYHWAKGFIIHPCNSLCIQYTQICFPSESHHYSRITEHLERDTLPQCRKYHTLRKGISTASCEASLGSSLQLSGCLTFWRSEERGRQRHP